MNKTIKIPESIEDITLGQYQQYEKAVKRDDLTSKELTIRIVKIFTGLQANEVMNISQKELDEIVSQIDKALNTEAEFKNRFIIGGVEFGFIPNFDDLKAKEFFDLHEYNDDVDSLHKLMAILYRPILKKDFAGNYSIVDYQGTSEWAEVMKQTPLSIVSGALAFFLNLSEELLSYTRKYLNHQEQAKEAKQKNTSKSGGGMRRFIAWLKASRGKSNILKT